MQFPTFNYLDLQFNPAAYKGNSFSFQDYLSSLPSSSNSKTKTSDNDSSLAGVFERIYDKQNDPARIKQILADQVAFQGELMKQAAPYKMLFELPDKLYNAFALPGQIRLAGARAAGEVVSEGLRSAAMVQMPGLNYQRPNIQYF